jgi:hypothetical protein
VGFWWVWDVGTSLVCLALAAQNMGRTGPIPPPTPVGDPGAALLVGALLWALVSVVVATESANQGMRRRNKWGWVASFLVASVVAAYAFFRRFV